MPHPRRRSPESSRRRRREKRLSREEKDSLYSSPSSITPQQMPGSYSADSPQQQQQPYQPPPQSQFQPQFQQPQPQQQPPLPLQQQAFPSPPQQQYPYPQHYQQMSLPMPQHHTPSQDAAQPRSRASSGSLSSSPSSSSSSYTEITRVYPTSRFGNFISTFVKAPSEVRRKHRRRGSGTKKRRGVFFGGGSNSSHSSINSDMAYGTGFVKKEKDRSTRYSSSVAGSAVSGSRQQQQQQYPPAAASRPSPKLLNEGKRNKTDEEILAIGRQLSDLARRSNEEDLRAAGKTRPSGLASTAAAISALRKSRKEAKKRGLAGSKKHRASSSDESDWESASDDDGDSSESSSSDDSTSALAYGGDSSRSNVALSGLVGAAAGAATGAVASSVASSKPTYHSRKSSVVDPRLFGPVNSLRGLVHTPCGFGDEQPPPASMSSNRYDNDRPATGESQADSTHRPGPIPLQQPIPIVPVSNKVFEAGRRDSRNSYRRQLSNSGSLDPTLSGGVAAAAAAAAAAMADQRGPWTEDRIYRDNVKLTRPDPEEDYFQRDQAPFEELERRRANPEVYYNRRNDNDSPRLESDRQVPDYAKDSSNLPRDSRSWMELHPEERKETLKYQTTYDAHMRDTERQLREDKLRDAQRQQQQQQQPPQPARAIKAGDRNIETTAQPVPKPLIDPFQYQVANDAFNTPQFNTPRRGRTPEIVTVDRVPNFANPSPAPAPAPAPPPSQMPLRPQSNADIRLSRKDSYEIERAAEERRRGGESESRSRDPRGGYEYEQEEKDARSILDEAKHSTIPVAAVAIASAIAVEEERSRERKRREYSDDGSRDRNRPAKDAVQEDADRYYRESVIARKIASDEIRSRSHSPDESVVDKWEKPSAEESFSIVAPPSMEDREHDDDENPYAPPNADVRIDNEIFPHETDRFRATNGLDAARFTSRDASCERERPLLNIVRPTPVPSPDSTSVGLKQSAEVPASREIEKEEESIASSEDEESDAKGEATHSSPSGKSVTWGENSTKRFVVESPESRSRAESPNELAEAEDKPRPRLSKISQWGKIAAMMAAGTAEPTTELDRDTASRSRDLPADDDVNGAPPVPGPKPASPEPEQMPGTFSDDLEFTATVAAGLEKSGFDPNIVIDDPDFRRRGSRPETSETPVMGHAETERSAEEPLPASEDDLAKDREVVADEEELSLADTEESEDEKTQKQRKLNALEKYLQMRQSGEIKPPSQPAEPVETPAVVERPITPPQNNERRNMLEKFLQRRQSGEIQPPREVLESRNLEPVPEAQDDDEDKKAKRERLEKFLQMRQSNQTEEPETTEAVPRHIPEAEQPPTRTPLHPEALAQLDDSASDFAPSKSKKKKKKKRRDRLDDERSGLSIPGDEGTEISRISVPGDEATVFSVEDWEDWDSSPRSTRRSIVASELSTSSRRSTRPKRRSGTEKDLREVDGNEPPPYSRDGPTDQDDERRPRSRESKSSQYNDNSEKPISSRKRKDSSGKKSGFLSGIFNKSGGKETINEKGDSFFEQAGILGAGAGLASLAASAATALTRSNAADVSSDPENISRDLPGSSREDEDVYPVIAPRAIAIDPQYGDLLPLPPSEPGTPLDASLDKLPGLPDSRPGTPDEDRARRFEKTHRRQRSNQESSRNRSHSNTAVPLALLRGIGSSPSSPVMAFKPPRTPPRPTSWDSTKEFMPLMLLEHARRGSADLKGEELPPLPPSEVSSEAEGGAMSDREEDRLSSALRLRPEDFRSPMPPNDGFSSTDHQLRLQTDIPTMGRSVSDEGSEGSTPKADLTYELPVPPTNNTLGDYDAPAPVESTPSSGQSARTVDAQAIPSPTTPTRRFLSPNKDIRHHAEELTSADASDDFETARTSPADINDDDELFEPPPIEPSMLGAIPEFSRPAKFWEDKVPEHSEPTSVDKVIETLPSVKNVPKDQARQGSPSYLDPLLESAEESSTKGKNRSLLPDADTDFDLSAQPTADETLAAFVEVPESVLAKEPALDADRGFSDEYTSIKERKALPVMVEDESEPEPERYASGPELELDKEPVAVFEPVDEVVEAPYTEAVDIVPVSEELSYDAIAESAQHSDSEEVEEIVIGTIPTAKSRAITEAATEVKAEPVLEEPEPVQRDAGQEYPRKPEASPVIEDSEESEEEEEETDEEEDSEDSEESEEDSEEEEEHAVADVGKHVGEEGHAVRDMTASVETLGAVSVVSSSSKKSKKKKKKKKKKRKRKKKTKAAAAAAAAAAAVAATEASHDTPIQHAKEPAESTIMPVVEPATETPSDATRALPTKFDRNDSEPITQPGPVDAVEAVEAAPLDLAKESPIQEPVSEAPEQFTREIAEEPIIEKAQEVVASPEFTPREGLEPVSEPTPLAETEEPQTIPSTAVGSTNNDADGLEDELLKWANTDSEPIPHSDHAKIDEADTLSPELSDEQDGEKRSIQVEDETIAVEEKPETLAPLQEEFPSQEEPAAEETPIESPAVAEEHVDADATDSLASDADELASVPREESPSADREWAASPEYEDTMLPTIMEEDGFEEGIEGEDEFDRDAPFSDQLSPILEESLEDLMEDSAPEKTSDQESIEPTLGSIPEESAWSIGRAEDQPEQQIAEETRYLEPIGEESDATAVVEDISLQPQMDENVLRSIGEIAETPDSKPLDWAPPQLPSFASDISEPLFTQGDVPSEYPTQQSPAGYEPTQMDESFAVPEEPSRSPPPVPDAADEGDSKAIEPEYSEVPLVPEEPSRTPPPADEFESPEAVVIPEEPSRPPPSIPGATNEAESLDAVETPEEPSRPPPPVPTAADEGDSKAAELDPLEDPVEADVDVPSLEPQEDLEENVANFDNTADITPSTEEREQVDEQLSTAAPDATVQEPELKEVDSPAEGDNNEERQEPSVSLDLEPTKQEEQELVASDSAPPMESIISQFPALQEEYKAQDDMAIEQPSGQDLNLDVTPQEDQSTLDAELPEPHDEDHEAKDVEPVSQQEPETIPLQEADRELDLEPKAEQEAVDDGLQPPMNNTDLENEGSGDISREVVVDTTKLDTHLETGTSEDARPIHEEERGPEMENNDTKNLDAEKREEKSEHPEQSVELDSTEPNMTSELEQPTLEAEIAAPTTTPPNAEEKDSEQMNLAQDDAIAPVSTEHQHPSAEVEPATEAELQTEDPLAPEEAQPPTEKEINEPENERQGSAVAEGLDQFEAPAEIIKEDSIDTTLPGSDTVTDANDASRLDNDTTVVDEARSDPAGVVDSGIPETARDIMPVVEDKEAAGDDLVQEGTSEDQVAHDLQPEVPSTMTDAPAEDEPKLEEAQPELKPEELPLEQISHEHQQEPKSDEPEPESVVEEANRGLDLASEEFQQEPKLEETQEVPAGEELQQEPVSETQESKLEEPHHDSSDDESEHESQSKELEPSTTDSQLQDVDEATAKKIAKKERKKARRRARAAAAAVEEAVVDPSTLIAERDLPPAEAISLPTEEPKSTEPVDQPESEAALPTEPQEETSKPTEEPQEKPFVPDSPEVRQSRTWETDKSRKNSSMFLSIPGAADSSGSEDDSDDDASYVSDMSYQHSEAGSFRFGGPNDSTSRLTGFEVTATPRGEQHAHRDRHRKKKKKKGGKKHKRKKSRSGGSERGSDPSSSLPSLPTTSNPNLASSVPNLNDGQPSISDELADKEQKPSSNVGEGAAAEPPAPVAGGSRNIDELLSEFADDPELMDPPQSQRVGSITAPLDTIPEDASGEDVGSPRLKEPMSLPDNKDSEMSRPSEEQIEEEPENAWDMFTGNWGKSSGKRSESDLTRSLELAPDERPPQDLLDRKQAHMIQDAPLVDEPAEISTPQRRNSQTDNTASDEPAGSELQTEKRASSFSGTQSPKGKDPKSRPGSASSQGSNQWLGFLSERFGPKKKKTRDRDKDPIGEDDKEDPNEESFLGNPALRKSGDERSWETKIETLDDFLQRSGSPTTPKKRKRRQGQSDTPTTPKRTESIVEARDDGDAVERRLKRGDVFGGQLVDSPILEAMEVLGPFELLKRNAQVEDPIGGLLREASEISVLPPMDMMSEISDYDLSDYRLSPRGLPSVEELPEAEAEATASEVGYYRDSSFSGSPPSRSRRHSTSTIPIEDNEEKLRDSGIDADWLEAAMKQLKTPEPMNRTPERQPQRRLRRSTLGGQKLREPTSLREAAKDPEKKTIPGTRERVLTGTGTRPETPTGRSSPTRKGYGAITGMGFGRLANGRVSPMPASSASERSDTPPVLKRLRRARPESPSVPLMPAATEQPRSVSDSKIPSATGRQTGDEARADPGRGRGTPNSGLVRQRTPERLKFSQQDGSTVRSSSNPTPPLLRRAERRFSLRQPNSSTSSIAPNPIPSPMPASTNPSPIPTPTPFSTSTSKPELATAPKLTSEAPVANEGRVRAKDKPDVYDGFGEGRIGSPLSPTRPHSMRRRQSMQVLELEARVEQLIAENRLLSDARHSTDQHLSHRVVTALSDRDTQIESLKQTLKFLRGEVSRLTEVNDGLSSANAELANKDNSRYADLQVHADRGENQDALMQALRDKDAQIASLTAKLDAAKEKIRELQRQILESQAADVQFLNIKDEDYFDHRCQQLCSHVQQWVLRFSKFSDMRACRLTSEINDEKIIDRLDNAVLDGSDVDRYLNDRVRRRDIFMSMTMNMIWEFVFTRYLFGMDREQRQKLKSLEKLLTEVGPPQAVRQWRAVTLTLLSKRDSFKRQRDLDTEAVVQAIYQTLCKVLPPPSNLEAQIQAQLRRVMHEAVHLSIEMRTQKAEYMMLPPLQPEYDADGELVQTVQFNASMMNERSPSSLKLTNEELEARGAIVRVVLFPLVVKKGDDDGSNDEEIVVHPAQVLIARSKLTRQPTPSDGGRVSVGTGRLSGGTNSPSTRTSDVI
ncbi:hypothetical protein J3E68DRAFT_448594 [Trichoderma sp. SZMC 28012]